MPRFQQAARMLARVATYILIYAVLSGFLVWEKPRYEVTNRKIRPNSIWGVTYDSLKEWYNEMLTVWGCVCTLRLPTEIESVHKAKFWTKSRLNLCQNWFLLRISVYTYIFIYKLVFIYVCLSSKSAWKKGVGHFEHMSVGWHGNILEACLAFWLFLLNSCLWGYLFLLTDINIYEFATRNAKNFYVKKTKIVKFPKLKI